MNIGAEREARRASLSVIDATCENCGKPIPDDPLERADWDLTAMPDETDPLLLAGSLCPDCARDDE